MVWTSDRGGPGRRTPLASLASLVAVVGLAAVGCGSTAQPPPTARVERGSVSVSVSASGALSAVQAQNLGFAKGGELKELLVKVGDPVQPGQLLARVDDFAAQQALNQARARLAQQQAQLDKIVNGNSVEAAQSNLDQTRKILDATRANAAAINEADRKATYRAEKELEFDERQLDQARAALQACETATPPPIDGCASQQQAVTAAEAEVVASKTALSNAREKENVDATQGRLSIEQARQNVVTAESDLDAARSNRPADQAAQAAAVAEARVSVTLAQTDVNNTMLHAPIAGTIASINGAVGEFLNPGSTSTPMAPGSTAAIPGIAVSSSNDGAALQLAPGGSTFIMLGNVDSFQVVVPFEEADAARVQPGQRVEVTLDAIPDLVRAGTVLAVGSSGTAISGVTNYYVTVALTETDPRLRDRQTAEAKVQVGGVDDVLSVPNAAVIRKGGQSFVNVPGPDGEPQQVPFEPGLVGDDRTEVRSGPAEGQEVLLPQATVVASPEGQGGPAN